MLLEDEMTIDEPLGRKIEAAREHLEALRQLVGPSSGQQARVAEPLEALSASLEGLYAAVEELRQQNEELVASRRAVEVERQRYRAVIEDQTDLICRFLPDGTLTFVNEAYCRYFGRKREGLIGRSLMALIPECDQGFFKRQLASLSPENPVVTHEHRVILPSGEVRWQRWSNRAIFDVQDRLVEFQSVGRDVTERKRAREERERMLVQAQQDRQSMQDLAEILERERHTLQATMENTHAHLAYLDPDLNFVRVNSAYARGSGYSKGELIGRNHFDLFPHAENQAIFERVRDTGEPAVFHAKPFVYPDRPDLGITYWDWSLLPVMDRDGQVQGLVLSLLDVTERERAERKLEGYTVELEQRVAERTAELQASETRFRTLFQEAAIGIALVDKEIRLVETNPALQEILGYSGEELGGVVFTALCHPDDVSAGCDPCEELMAGESDYFRTKKRYVRKDGRPVWANVTGSLVRDAGGEPQFAICMVEDITEQKRTQEALLQVEKLTITGKLAASLAHEINNPLQSIIGCLGLAEETLAEGGDVGRYLQVALGELRRVARIVAGLRNLIRPSKLGEREPADVNALLKQVLTLSRKNCEERGVEMVWTESPGLPSLSLVLDRMQQVFLNLVLNAVDAMPDGGRLQVSTSRTDQPDGVRISFTDSGVGIAPDVLPRIFDVFYSTKRDGLGLGLSISRDIVEGHGGRIEADSFLGEGTTFTVWLPA
jgi:PAS domain S-box-containing protein